MQACLGHHRSGSFPEENISWQQGIPSGPLLKAEIRTIPWAKPLLSLLGSP
jgi:hypothetical protein